MLKSGSILRITSPQYGCIGSVKPLLARTTKRVLSQLTSSPVQKIYAFEESFFSRYCPSLRCRCCAPSITNRNTHINCSVVFIYLEGFRPLDSKWNRQHRPSTTQQHLLDGRGRRVSEFTQGHVNVLTLYQHHGV